MGLRLGGTKGNSTNITSSTWLVQARLRAPRISFWVPCHVDSLLAPCSWDLTVPAQFKVQTLQLHKVAGLAAEGDELQRLWVPGPVPGEPCWSEESTRDAGLEK